MLGKNEPIIEGIKGDTGDPGSQGEPGPQGISLQYRWQGTQLGVKREDEASYQYTDLQGPRGEQGIQGLPGKTPAVSFRINEAGHLIMSEEVDDT